MFKRLFLTAASLCLAMAVSAVKPDPKAMVAKVGDRSFTYKTYNDGFKAYLSYHMGGKTLTAQDSIRLNDQYWSELVGVYIYDQAIKAGKVKVTDAEVERDITANPPDGVKIIKDFQTNGVFDAKKYKQALKDRPDFKKSAIDLSRSLYTYEKLVRTIKNEAAINPDSIKAEWLKANDKADATIVVFDYTRLPHISSTQAELEQHYQQNLQDYRRENGKNYLYVRISNNQPEGEDVENQLKQMKNISSALHARAKQIGLTEAAKEAGLKVEESGFFSSTAKEIPQIGASPNLIGFAFANGKGAIPEVFYAPGGDIFVCEVNNEVPEFYLDLESQKDAIGKQLSLQKRIAQMHEYAQSFRLQQTRETFLEAANQDSLMVIDALGVTYDALIKKIGKIPALNQAILDTAEGNFTPLIEKENRWLLAMIQKRYAPDMAVWDKDKDSIIATATSQKQQQHLNKWYMAEYNKLEIIDHRKDFYPLVNPLTPGNTNK